MNASESCRFISLEEGFDFSTFGFFYSRLSVSSRTHFLVVNIRSFRILAQCRHSCFRVRKAAEFSGASVLSLNLAFRPLSFLSHRKMSHSGSQYAEGAASITWRLDKYNKANKEQLSAMIRGRAGVFVWRRSLGKYAYEHRHSRGQISELRNSLYNHSSKLVGMVQNEEDRVSSTSFPRSTQTADTFPD